MPVLPVGQEPGTQQVPAVVHPHMKAPAAAPETPAWACPAAFRYV